MRVLLSTYGSRGDTEPLVALAVALQQLGAEAIVSAPPDRDFVDLTERAGVTLAPAFMSVRDWIANARREPKDLPTYASMMIGPQYEAIDAAAEDCDVIVATGLMPSAAAAQCVAEKRGLAYRHVSFCPLFLPSEHHKPYPNPHHPPPAYMTDPRALWNFNARATNALFGGAINTQRSTIGLPPIDDVRAHVFTAQPWLASDPVLWPWQPTEICDAVQTGAWILRDERELPADLQAFLEAGAPPVCVGFGSISMPHAKELAQAAVEAVRGQGKRLVLSRGWADMGLVDDGDDCFLIGEVNQQKLFPRCAALVHHGGAGTTTAATRSGAPQVIVPQIVDQPYWAARVAGLGIGVAHDGAVATRESLSAALELALTVQMKVRAVEVAGAMRKDGAMIAAKLLLGR